MKKLNIKFIYNFIYGTVFEYYKKLWGNNKDIVPLNVTIGLSFSLIAFISSIFLIIHLIFDLEAILFLESKLYSIILVVAVFGIHFFLFEYKSKYKTVLKWYRSQSIFDKNKKKYFVYLYIFGSILLFFILLFIEIIKIK